jgi:protein-S-isoprenylcysteine O-methyltransferase Ste14
VRPIPGDLALWSFYGYFVLFFLAEWALSRSTLGAKSRGDRDPATLLFFVVPSLGIFAWITILRRVGGVHPTWLSWGAGLTAAVAGLGIRAVAKRALGRFFSIRVQVQEGHRLIREGLYSRIRHPLYTGLLLAWCAPPLLLGSPLGFLLVTLPQAILVLQRIPREEALLIETFGDEYRAYMATTKRLIPGVW